MTNLPFVLKLNTCNYNITKRMKRYGMFLLLLSSSFFSSQGFDNRFAETDDEINQPNVFTEENNAQPLDDLEAPEDTGPPAGDDVPIDGGIPLLLASAFCILIYTLRHKSSKNFCR